MYIENEICCATEDARDTVLSWQGATNGSVSSFILGISSREKTYSVPDSELGFKEMAACLARLGRLAVFREYPDAIGALKINGMSNVVLYVCEQDIMGENTLTVTCFTARGLLSGPRLKNAFRLLDRVVGLNTEIETKADNSQEEN